MFWGERPVSKRCRLGWLCSGACQRLSPPAAVNSGRGPKMSRGTWVKDCGFRSWTKPLMLFLKVFRFFCLSPLCRCCGANSSKRYRRRHVLLGIPAFVMGRLHRVSRIPGAAQPFLSSINKQSGQLLLLCSAIRLGCVNCVYFDPLTYN